MASAIAEVVRSVVKKSGSLMTRLVTFNLGGGDAANATHTSSLGDDSAPVEGDFAVLAEAEGNGTYTVVGYADSGDKVANPGEKRIYGRDASGAEVCQAYLKNDGSIEFSNDGGSFTLNPSGIVETRAMIVTESIILAGRELNLHTHVSATPGSSSGPNQ